LEYPFGAFDDVDDDDDDDDDSLERDFDDDDRVTMGRFRRSLERARRARTTPRDVDAERDDVIRSTVDE